MNRHTTITAAMALCFLMAMQTQAISEAHASAPTITVTKLDVKGDALNLAYEISNNSEDDAWVLTGGYQHSENTFGMGAGVHLAENSDTLTIGIRFNKSSTGEGLMPIYGRFVRLRPGESQTETICLKTPVFLRQQAKSNSKQGRSIQYATNLIIELGYCPGNLPEKILKKYKEEENKRPLYTSISVIPQFYSSMNECLGSRDEEFLIIWPPDSILECEDVLRTVVKNVRIPYEEISPTDERRSVECESPDLTSCIELEIKYQPSMLEYFFPFAFQQNLLNSEELEYSRSEKVLFLEDVQKIEALANDIRKTATHVTYGGALIERYRSSLDVICSFDSKPPISFSIYNDNALRIDDDVTPCSEGFPSLKILTPKIHAIDLRMHCAANLKNQWYRFHLFHFNEAINQNDKSIRNRIVYPMPSQWCDDIRRSYPVFAVEDWWKKLHVCPSASGGKNHYAMNPNCQPDSPPDMVLLFETKDGWNQHGGPELFTFDNHDPKGGCVLLNDGTVKFIRTAEELRQLRWK